MKRIIDLISKDDKRKLTRYIDCLSTRRPLELDSGLITLLDFNIKEIILNPYFLDVIAKAIVTLARETNSDVVIGPGGGGAILVGAATELSMRWNTPLKGAVINREGKITGKLKPTHRLLLVDDVINSGKTLIRATYHIIQQKLYITKAFAAIKREFPGPTWYQEKTGILCEVLVDGSDILKQKH